MNTYKDSTLLNMTKKELLEQLRCAEHNREVAENALAQQAENLKDWEPIIHAHWIKEQIPLPLSDSSKICYCCSNCHTHWDLVFKYCPNCGAKMDEGDAD